MEKTYIPENSVEKLTLGKIIHKGQLDDKINSYEPIEESSLTIQGHKIGEGGFGTVHEMINLQDMKTYAVKKLTDKKKFIEERDTYDNFARIFKIEELKGYCMTMTHVDEKNQSLYF